MLQAALNGQHPHLIAHAQAEDARLLDVFNCVEQLYAENLHDALTKEAGECWFNKVPRPGRTPSRVLVSQLALALPRHVLGCLLSGQPAVPPDAATVQLTTAEITSTSCFDHIAKALTLITSLCELSFHHKQLREATIEQPAFGLELIDAANMVLLSVAGPEAEACMTCAATQDTIQAALDRGAMVPAALRALAFAFTARSGGQPAAAAAASGVLDWQAICEALLQHPRGAVLLEAGFDAVRTVVLAVRAGLVGNTDGTPVYHLAYNAGAATELLSYMCVTPLFYQRLMLHDASGAAPLRLVLACLTLHDTPLAAPPFARSTDRSTNATVSKLVAVQPPYCTEKGDGAAELLAARGFALLLMLSECEQPSFMDQVAQHQATRRLADHVNNRAAAYIGQVLLRPSTSLFPAAEGESQMAINTLRAAELLSDDSNFRAGLIPLLAPTSAHLLASDPDSFRLRWVAGAEAVAYHQEDEILINSVSTASMAAVKSYERASTAFFGGARKGRALRMGQHLALERAVLLAKLLVNLHVYVEGSCSPDLKDAFVRRMIQVLCSPPSTSVQRLQATLRNLHQLSRQLAPFGLPAAPPDQQLLSEIDMALMADLIHRVTEALVRPQQPPQQQQPQQQQQQQQQQQPQPSSVAAPQQQASAEAAPAPAPPQPQPQQDKGEATKQVQQQQQERQPAPQPDQSPAPAGVSPIIPEVPNGSIGGKVLPAGSGAEAGGAVADGSGAEAMKHEEVGNGVEAKHEEPEAVKHEEAAAMEVDA